MSELERAILDRRIKALEEEARIEKNFRDYAMKRFAECSQGEAERIKNRTTEPRKKEEVTG